MQDSAIQNSEKFLYSDVRITEFIEEKMYRVVVLKSHSLKKFTHLPRHRRKDLAAKCLCYTVCHGWCLSGSQSKLVYVRYILVVTKIRISGLTNVTKISNSFFMSYAKSMANSSTLSGIHQVLWHLCAWVLTQAHRSCKTMKLLVFNLAKCSSIFFFSKLKQTYSKMIIE